MKLKFLTYMIDCSYKSSLWVSEGLSCVIGLLGRYELAATLGQHCPYLTPRLCYVCQYLTPNNMDFMHITIWCQSLCSHPEHKWPVKTYFHATCIKVFKPGHACKQVSHLSCQKWLWQKPWSGRRSSWRPKLPTCCSSVINQTDKRGC